MINIQSSNYILIVDNFSAYMAISRKQKKLFIGKKFNP